MTTSGTQAFTLDLAELIEEAFEQAGSELRTGYNYRTARRSMDLLFLEWQNEGINLWTVKSASQALTANQATYSLTDDKLDIVEAVLRTDAGSATSQTDLSMDRISVRDYAHQTNKLQTGRPIKFYVEQSPSGLTLNVWPVPDGAQTYTIFYYYMARIEDTGKPGSNTVDIPDRFLPALAAGLAYKLSLKLPGGLDRAPALKTIYDGVFKAAADSAREKAVIRLVPGGY